MEKQAFEQTGLVPRSIIRTLDRFKRQLLPGAETAVIQEFRISRYQVLVSVKCLIIIIFIPLIVNLISKTFILKPLTEYFWNTQQNEIFLNLSQQEKAFSEMRDFEEIIYFETLLENKKYQTDASLIYEESFENTKNLYHFQFSNSLNFVGLETKQQNINNSNNQNFQHSEPQNRIETTKIFKEKFKQKTIELANYYNKQSIDAITNLFGEFLTFITLSCLLILMKPQIIILKSFLTESIYSLSDTTKSFLLILLTHLLVGFHSPRGWEILIDVLCKHFGLPENQNFIFFFVATFPVFLDTVFKYWIFRHLNKISPSTVATYHSMIE